MDELDIAGVYERGQFDKDAQGWCGEVLRITQEGERVTIVRELHDAGPGREVVYVGRVTEVHPAHEVAQITLDDATVVYFSRRARHLGPVRPAALDD